jgi:sortase (surface protein transpeptidase)
VAFVSLKGKNVPVKAISFRTGGVLDPPATNQAAGISTRNAPLSAKKGVTVITWHVRYGPGCNGTLNPLMTMAMGSTFTVAAVGKRATTYQITGRETVAKSGLKRSWFSNEGPHRMVLFTCTDYRGGVFHKTMAVIASPVRPTPITPTTPTAPPIPTTTIR